jgi:hypothetical protein
MSNGRTALPSDAFGKLRVWTCAPPNRQEGRNMPDYLKIRLANGDTRHLPTLSASRSSGMVADALQHAFGQITVRTAEGTMIIAAHIVEAELVLDHKDIQAAEHSEYL